MDIVKFIAELDGAPELHAARLLVLLNAFPGPPDGNGIIGLTKLAKLDFLLRYPVMLEKALQKKRASIKGVEVEEHERISVESTMVRYRFGPWDHRYREVLNTLVARGLVALEIQGRAIRIELTQSGKMLAVQVQEQPEFAVYAARSSVLKRHFDLQATNLMRFIYDAFPEILTLRSNEVIPT